MSLILSGGSRSREDGHNVPYNRRDCRRDVHIPDRAFSVFVALGEPWLRGVRTAWRVHVREIRIEKFQKEVEKDRHEHGMTGFVSISSYGVFIPRDCGLLQRISLKIIGLRQLTMADWRSKIFEARKFSRSSTIIWTGSPGGISCLLLCGTLSWFCDRFLGNARRARNKGCQYVVVSSKNRRYQILNRPGCQTPHLTVL
jgi:hypothetical protein